MTTPATAAPCTPTTPQWIQDLGVVVDGMAKGLSAKLVPLVEQQAGGKKLSGKTVEELLRNGLEEAFVTQLLAGKGARRHRALLAHVLSSIEVDALRQPSVPEGDPAVADPGAADEEELTSEAAARLLHVSRSHLNALADAGKLGTVRRTAGSHRRLSKSAVLAYRELSKQRQAKGLDAMLDASRTLGLYDDEMDMLPRRPVR